MTAERRRAFCGAPKSHRLEKGPRATLDPTPPPIFLLLTALLSCLSRALAVTGLTGLSDTGHKPPLLYPFSNGWLDLDQDTAGGLPGDVLDGRS